MIRETVNALAACLVTFVLCAVAYPAAVWGLGQLVFPQKAEGSLVYSRDRTVIGSELIAQPFASDRYFQPRPSAADYKADAASGSNLGTKNPDLHTKVKERSEALKATTEQPAPADLISASAASPAVPDLADDVAKLRAEIGGASTRIKQLLDRVEKQARAIHDDNAAREKTREELKRIEERVTGLTASSRDVSGLIDRVGGLDKRVESANESIRTLGTNLDEARKALKGIATSPGKR
jgi:K+-transporting ATPase ATPase C chain